MQAIHTQVNLIEHVQNLLSEALSSQDIELTTVFGSLLEQLTNGYGSLTKGSEAASQPAPTQGWSSKKVTASFRSQPQPTGRAIQQSRPPVKPQPQSYVYADGFQGVELPIATDRDELPTSDYWEDTQG